MTTKIKVALLIVALIVAGGVGYAILTVKPAGNIAPVVNVTTSVDVATSTVTQESSPLILQGTVTVVDAGKMQITLQTSTTNPLKVAAITSATKIEKVISQKDAKGIVEKQTPIEVNVGDVQKGDIVTVVYQSEKDGILSGVSRITFIIEGNIDAYFKSQSANQTPYLKGRVVAIDIAGKMLQYKPIIFDTIGTTTMSVAIPDGIPVYRANDPARVSIAHARTAAKLADIRSGETIFILADPEPLKKGNIVPKAFIILGSK